MVKLQNCLDIKRIMIKDSCEPLLVQTKPEYFNVKDKELHAYVRFRYRNISKIDVFIIFSLYYVYYYYSIINFYYNPRKPERKKFTLY